MSQKFMACDREQELLLPPGLREWLPQDHLVWFVLDAVEQVDLSAVYDADCVDEWGRAASHPSMMVALFLYAYAVGERSSRGIAEVERILAEAGQADAAEDEQFGHKRGNELPVGLADRRTGGQGSSGYGAAGKN